MAGAVASSGADWAVAATAAAVGTTVAVLPASCTVVD